MLSRLLRSIHACLCVHTICVRAQAKDLVEGSPAVLLKNVKKEEADALVAKLKEVGAVLELE